MSKGPDSCTPRTVCVDKLRNQPTFSSASDRAAGPTATPRRAASASAALTITSRHNATSLEEGASCARYGTAKRASLANVAIASFAAIISSVTSIVARGVPTKCDADDDNDGTAESAPDTDEVDDDDDDDDADNVAPGFAASRAFCLPSTTTSLLRSCISMSS